MKRASAWECVKMLSATVGSPGQCSSIASRQGSNQTGRKCSGKKWLWSLTLALYFGRSCLDTVRQGITWVSSSKGESMSPQGGSLTSPLNGPGAKKREEQGIMSVEVKA